MTTSTFATISATTHVLQLPNTSIDLKKAKYYCLRASTTRAYAVTSNEWTREKVEDLIKQQYLSLRLQFNTCYKSSTTSSDQISTKASKSTKCSNPATDGHSDSYFTREVKELLRPTTPRPEPNTNKADMHHRLASIQRRHSDVAISYDSTWE